MRSTPASTLLAAILLPATAAAQFYVDPVGGADVPGAGALTQPFKTVAACVASLPAGAHTITILPGECTVYSGEVFPIHLPDAITIAALIPGTVKIATSIVSAEIPDAFVLPPTATYAAFRGVAVKANSKAIRANPAPGVFLRLEVT